MTNKETGLPVSAEQTSTVWMAIKSFFITLAEAASLLFAMSLVYLGFERDSLLYLLGALVFLFVFCKEARKRR